jgi:hypothetical protein
VVMEATSDCWKPFYYVLEDGPFEVMLVNARHVKNVPAARPMCPTLPGWPIWGLMGWSGGRSCRPNRSTSYGT